MLHLLNRLFLGTLLLLLPLSPGLALDPPNIEEFRLQNGMDVIVLQNRNTEAVSHNLLFRFGAADDPHGKSGLAHYLEHMMFQGSENLAPNEYSRKIASHGGQSNAFTSPDYTGYWANISWEYLPLVMKLEAERLQNLQPPVEDFNREKQVILEERRSRVDNKPLALFHEQLRALLFYHHPYGTPIIGWAEEMRNLSREDVLAYYETLYHPGNSVLVIAGHVDVEEARQLAEQYYEDIPNRAQKPAMRTQEPQQLGPRTFKMKHAKAGHPHWEKRFVVPSYGWRKMDQGVTDTELNGRNQQILALTMAEYLLGGSKSGRLYKRLVEQEELATNISVSYYPFRLGPAEFSLRLQPVKSEYLPKIVTIIDEEIKRLATHPPSEKEMQRAATQLIAGNTYVRDGLQPLARVIGHLKMLKLPLDFYFQWEENVKTVTAQQVSDSLALLDEDYSVTGTLLPE